jgi:hypothetical protein
MTVALFVGVMATVFRIRWVLTVHFLELAIRVVLLSALFTRSGARRLAKPLLPAPK